MDELFEQIILLAHSPTAEPTWRSVKGFSILLFPPPRPIIRQDSVNVMQVKVKVVAINNVTSFFALI